MRLRFSVFAFAIVLLLAACSDSSESTTTTEPQPVPSGWTTYSDETAGFSISYPGEWEIVQIDEVAVAELTGLDVGAVVRPLAAGLQLADNQFSPNVNVGIEVLPAEINSDEYAGLNTQAFESLLPNFTTSEQIKANVGGRDSVLLHGSFPVSDLVPGVDGYSWLVLLMTTEGSAGWSVGCTVLGSETSADAEDLETCNSVVRTFELSSP